MPRRLSEDPAIKAIAKDLGLSATRNSVEAIVGHCQERTVGYMDEFGGCRTSDELLSVCAQKCGARIEVASSLEDLDRLMRSWTARGEKQFATLEREFERGVLGITFKLQRPAEWEPPFVSVIDARGERSHRAWFTKWHELGHLLILGSGSRESFCRTHDIGGIREPEEALVDRIAGACGFHPKLVRPFADGPLTLDKIEAIRQKLCPGASIQASRLGIVNAWPRPCLLLECKMSNRVSRSAKTDDVALRAVSVWPNAAARASRTTIFGNMRVPERSVITAVFKGQPGGSEGENLNWWKASGSALEARHVLVSAEMNAGGSVTAVLTAPNGEMQPNHRRRGRANHTIS
jgi:hypothetical protein